VRVRLVPGFTNTARSWQAVEWALPRDWDVQTLDIPDGLDFVATADALAHRGGQAVWVGYSMGARLCLRLALDNPAIVERLVLVSGTAGIRHAGEREARVAEDEARARELERDGVEVFLDRWLDQRLFETLPPEAAMLEDRRRGNTVWRLSHQLRALGQGTQAPLWDRLSELSVPVLLVTGGYDRTYTNVARRMATEIGANATCVVIERSGHAVHLERPDELAHELTAWLDGTGAA
jgi:2-succinyl-6-hydroxy-2,4-cyclohexadiene-1-carboxylate synthase